MSIDFKLPAHSINLKGWKTPNRAQIFLMRSGSDSVAAMCRAMLIRERGYQEAELLEEDDLDAKLLPFVALQDVHDFSAGKQLSRVFTMKKVRAKHGDDPRNQAKLPCLRCGGEPEEVTLHSQEPLEEPKLPRIKTQRSVLIHVIGVSSNEIKEGSSHGGNPLSNPCLAHVQIGRATDEDNHDIAPRRFAQPTAARVVVVSLWEVCPEARIRRALSYEAIVVDLLRDWRGYGQEPALGLRLRKFLGLATGKNDESRPLALAELALDDDDKDELNKTWIVVRINSSAAVIYHLGVSGSPVPAASEEAFLCFHRDRPAPLDDSGMGIMYGYNGIIGASVATGLRKAIQERPAGPFDASSVGACVRAAVKDSILWQKAYFDHGLLEFFFQQKREDPAKKPKVDADWGPKEVASWQWAHCAAYLRAWQGSITDYRASEVALVEVPTQVAVSHRNQWFIIRQAFLDEKVDDDETQLQRKQRFLERAVKWLTDPSTKPANSLPILSLGNLTPVDRREVEDFLALHQAFLRYADNPDRQRPLNIAVFGPPGAGKSFGVKAVAGHIAAGTPQFSKRPLTFNFSQFTSLRDLVGAFHVVRNECLKKTIPVVFLDEFDSAFEGRPFGWLKYFLAPMQDGKFNDGSNEFELGHCVLVFAGGINRSFEEFNGRLRNPSFVEAKGPDFISRLRAHLNVRGINRPEDEASDQDRYILRRALMLHGMLKKRLAFEGSGQPPKGGFMHPAIASAFCEVKHFKHGARSLEAILDMSDLSRGRRLSPSDLPSKTQLDMHVDATQFLKIVYDQLDAPSQR